jgi:hypothetical protein
MLVNLLCRHLKEERLKTIAPEIRRLLKLSFGRWIAGGHTCRSGH